MHERQVDGHVRIEQKIKDDLQKTRFSSGGFLGGDFYLTRKDRVMFRFFGRLGNSVGELQEEPKP
ncbi:MAG: hypothetical protein NT162_01340 [Candidatus Woesebacteria bacterium]|nr:hypothetical protein [Candidatus Woesebacteria bacterium]